MVTCMERIDRNRYLFNTLKVNFILCFIAYGYAMVNFTPSHDGIRTVAQNQVGMAAFGRVLVQYYVMIRGIVNAPWLITLIGSLFLGLCCYLVMKLLNIEYSIWKTIVVSIVLSLNICVISNIAVYNYVFDVYMCAFLMAVLSVYMSVIKHGYLSVLSSGFLLAISMGLYQSYFAVALALYILSFVRNALANEVDFLDYLKKIVKYLISLFLAAAVYYVGIKIITWKMNISLYSGAYNSVTNLKNLDIKSIFLLIPSCYRYFFDYYFEKKLYGGIIYIFLNVVVLLFSIIKYYHTISNSKEKARKILVLAFLFAIFPLCANCIYILNGGNIHYLMTMGIQFFYLLLFLPYLIDNESGCKELKLLFKGVFLIVVVLGFCIIRYSNEALYYMTFVGWGTESQMTNIQYDIEKNQDFDYKKTSIIIVGDVGDALSRDFPESEVFAGKNGITGIGGKQSVVTHRDTFIWYFKYLLGRNYSFENDGAVIEQIAESEEVIDMPEYPNDGYCKMVDGYLVLKMTEEK